MPFSADETRYMHQALALAARGQGLVEPNPMVGCVILAGGRVVGEGFHTAFGAPHAEFDALAQAGDQARDATMFVTLEPCCHQGKTPPCTQAIIRAGIARVVVAVGDPFSLVDGGGLDELRRAGIDVACGLLESEARYQNAPYFKRIATGRPWVIAKWAMSLDGKIATAGGDSRWISSDESRAIVHQLRGRVDAVIVGSGTAAADDPMLTARPPGPRTATRIVVDSRASIALDSRLLQTAAESPVMIAVATTAPDEAVARLASAGCEVVPCEGADHDARMLALLDELGRRDMTNVLVEGGGRLLGSLHDLDAIDEFHVFIAPKIIGGPGPSPVAGMGHPLVADASRIATLSVQLVGGDLYVQGRIPRGGPQAAAEP